MAIANLTLWCAVAPSLIALSNSPGVQAQEPAGVVFTMTNETTENRVVAFDRATDGTLVPSGSFATEGRGIGSGLGSQGSMLLRDTDLPRTGILYVCNAGSDTISVFQVTGGAPLHLVQVVPSGGDMPVSLTTRADILYVLNAGAGGSIAGFRVARGGALSPIAESSQPLTTPVGQPAQIEFGAGGDALVVTHKRTDLLRPPFNIIDTFKVGADGVATAAMPHESSGVEPFGFAVHGSHHVVVSEAQNGVAGESSVSSYRLDDSGGLELISSSIRNGQTASCWVVTTPEGYVFVTNTGSDTISSYTIRPTGQLELLHGVAAQTAPMSQPLDAALCGGRTGQQVLYVLLTGSGEVASYAVERGGQLREIAVYPAVPPLAGASGLVAF